MQVQNHALAPAKYVIDIELGHCSSQCTRLSPRDSFPAHKPEASALLQLVSALPQRLDLQLLDC